MRISVSQFIDYAYGDKRKDKSKVESIISDIDKPYDPAKDRYKQFREAMTSFEEGRITSSDFLNLHQDVSKNKAAGYKVLSRNYIDQKEDNALIWEGRHAVEANISGLRIATAWYLRTEENNQTRVIFLHFGKDPFPREKEKGILTVLRMAKPDSAGVGILNIQPSTLVTATRLDAVEADYLTRRAERFVEISSRLQAH